jgi:hypothetical protein
MAGSPHRSPPLNVAWSITEEIHLLESRPVRVSPLSRDPDDGQGKCARRLAAPEDWRRQMTGGAPGNRRNEVVPRKTQSCALSSSWTRELLFLTSPHPLFPSPLRGKGIISEIWVFGAAELPQTPKFPVSTSLFFPFYGERRGAGGMREGRGTGVEVMVTTTAILSPDYIF